MAEFFIKTMT